MSHEYANPLGFEHATGRVAGKQQNTVDVFNQSINTGKQQDIYVNAAMSCGFQQADPHAERKALETALETHFRDYQGKWSERIGILREAARKHLATLPKPEPKFRVVASLAKCTTRRTSKHYPRDEAVKLAADWMSWGAYDSVAVEQVSA